MKTRAPLALTAGAAAIASAALLATSGSAQGPAPTSLHFVSKTEKGVGFHPKHKPRQGDRVGFGDTVTGDDTGTDRGICTVIGKGQLLCNVVLNLSKGTLTAQGLAATSAPSNKSPFAITGGTGAYNGARGTALVTDVNRTTTNIEVTLRP